jgi:hypothetical protein|tara:strand:+ start:278 stop:568 length:291 start_codon:yes stop_codon:yes gene_type:complete
MKTTHDLCVATSKYTDKSGQEKTKYENIGKMGTRDDGSIWINFKRTFNPAGVPNPADSDTVWASVFEAKNNGQQQQAPQQQQASNANFPHEDHPFN